MDVRGVASKSPVLGRGSQATRRVAQVLGLQIFHKSGCPMFLAFGDMGKHETLPATDYSWQTPKAPGASSDPGPTRGHQIPVAMPTFRE
jgi:hypothetical protein